MSRQDAKNAKKTKNERKSDTNQQRNCWNMSAE